MIECLPFLVLRTPLQSTRYAYSPAGNAPALFEEGLYLASPDLWHELNKNGLSDAGMRAAYARYWLRSCTRSTPFGTFAGCSLAAVSDGDSHIVLGDQSSHDKAVRIDMNYFTRIVDELCLLPEIRNHIKFFPNNSHYQLPDEIRYVEYKLNNRDTREYSLTTVERSAYIDIIVQRAAAHGATIEELIDAIIAAKGMADRKDDITRFVVEVIGSQLLTPGIEPCLTGNDPLAELIRQLEVIAPGAHLCSQLKEIGQLLLHPGKGTAWYQLVENALQELRQDDHPIKYPLQVDLFPAFIA
ncbi:MAG TPA: lantibiotic dehydratase, partial [Chitinophaga sp.]|uniref:lantibiotic dehydratase n=1 Tax=Chitinophaga sp. TaxID=1869181 RepID=UPI002C2C6B1D